MGNSVCPHLPSQGQQQTRRRGTFRILSSFPRRQSAFLPLLFPFNYPTEIIFKEGGQREEDPGTWRRPMGKERPAGQGLYESDRGKPLATMGRAQNGRHLEEK